MSLVKPLGHLVKAPLKVALSLGDLDEGGWPGLIGLSLIDWLKLLSGEHWVQQLELLLIVRKLHIEVELFVRAQKVLIELLE